MGSRARTAAALCLVTGGVWAGAPPALADPADSADVTAGSVADGRTDHRTHTPSRATGKHGRSETDSETDAGAETAVADETGPAASDRRDEKSADDDTTGQNATAAARDDPSPPSCEGGGKDCGPGWPWPWPWPWSDDPDPPGAPNPSGGGSSSDRPVGVPRPGGPPSPGAGAPVVRPPEDLPFDPDIIDTVPGVGLPAAGEAAPISVPVLTIPVPAGTGGATAASAGSGAGIPAAPRQAPGEPPPARQPPPAPEAAPGPRVAPPGRIGYGETLRGAGTSQLAALALPGVVGILVLTALGGLLGYRQARAGQAMRAHGTARFMN